MKVGNLPKFTQARLTSLREEVFAVSRVLLSSNTEMAGAWFLLVTRSSSLESLRNTGLAFT